MNFFDRFGEPGSHMVCYGLRSQSKIVYFEFLYLHHVSYKTVVLWHSLARAFVRP